MTDQTVCGSYIMKERRLLALHTETAGIMPMIQKAIKWSKFQVLLSINCLMLPLRDNRIWPYRQPSLLAIRPNSMFSAQKATRENLVNGRAWVWLVASHGNRGYPTQGMGYGEIVDSGAFWRVIGGMCRQTWQPLPVKPNTKNSVSRVIWVS